MAPCRDCGVDEDSIAVPDAVLALRSFPRRFREALARLSPEQLRTRPSSEPRSALELAIRAQEVLELLADELPIVLDEPGAHLPDQGPDDADRHTSASVPTIDPDVVLGGITGASERLANRADETPWEAWDRTFTLGDAERPASWIVARAAHEGSHQLRDIDRVARLVGGRDEDD